MTPPPEPLDDLADVQDETIEPAPLSTGTLARQEAHDLTTGPEADAFRAQANAHAKDPWAAPPTEEEKLAADPWSTPPTDAELQAAVIPLHRPTDDNGAFNSWRAQQLNIPPDRAAASWDLAQRRGLDPTWTAQHFDDIKKTQDQEDQAALLAAHPGLAQQFEDPVKASIIKDDLPQASVWERLAQGRSGLALFGINVARSIVRGADPEQPYLSAKAMLGRASDDDYARLRELEAAPEYVGSEPNEFEKAIYGAAGALPFMAEAVGAGAVGALVAPEAAVGAAIGAGSVGVLTFAQSVGPLYRRMRATGADDETAFNWAVGASVVGGAIMGAAAPAALGVKGLLGGLAAKDGATTALATLTKSSALSSALKSLGGQFAMGVGMMTGQAAANSVAEQMARPGEFDAGEVLRQTGDAARSAAEAMALLAPWGPAAEWTRDQGRIGRISEDTVRIDALAKSVNDSKVSDPQIERVISELRQSGVQINPGDDARTVYVDRQAFDKIAAQNEVAPRELAARILGDNGGAWDTATAAGTSLPVPIEKYAANMVRSGLHDQLRGDVKFAPDGWTQNEATAARAQFEKYAAENPGHAAAATAIRERVLHLSLNSGQPIDVARMHADLVQAAIVRRAAQTGLSPEEVLRRHPLEIVGAGGAREPLAALPTPLPAPGLPRGPTTETFAEMAARPEEKARRNPFMPPLVEDPTPAGAFDDAKKTMAGPGDKFAMGPDESKAGGERLRAEAGGTIGAGNLDLGAPPQDAATEGSVEGRGAPTEVAARVRGGPDLVSAKVRALEPILERVRSANPALDETARVQEASAIVRQAKKSGKTIDQVMGEKADPFVQSMAHMLEGRSTADLGAAFEEWAKYASTPGAALERARAMLRQQSMDFDGSMQRLQQPEAEKGLAARDVRAIADRAVPESTTRLDQPQRASKAPQLSRWKYGEKIDPDARVNLVRGLDLPKGIRIGLNDAADREQLRTWIESHLFTKDENGNRKELPPIYNAQSRVKVTIGHRIFDTLAKVQSDGDGEIALANLPAIIKEAHFFRQVEPRERAPGKQADRDTLRYHQGVAAIETPEGVRRVLLFAKEMRAHGDRFHHLEVDDLRLEKRPASIGGQGHDDDSAVLMPRPPGTYRLGDLLEGVKDDEGLPVLAPDTVLTRLDQPGEDEEIARGHLAIIDGPNGKRYEIHLGPGADASTLAHETMHWLVDTLAEDVKLPGATPGLIADHDALMKWAGYAPGEREKGLVAANEERIASGWEQYLAEGEAPSAGLRGVFSRFARWMTKIYGGVSGIAGTYERTNPGERFAMNDEIRAIFDRMLATTDEINQEREANEERVNSGGGGAGAPPGGDGAGGGGGDGAGGGGDEPPPEPPRRKPVPEQTKRWATEVLRKRPISSIDPRFYLDAERKSSRRAIDFAAGGQREESRNADVTRSFAAALHDAAKDIVKAADAQLAKLRSLATPDALAKVAKSAANEAGSEYLDVQQSLLESLGLRPRSAGDTSQRAGVDALLKRLDFDGRDPAFDANGLRALIANPKAWSELTPEESENATNAALQIRTAANGANKVMVGTVRAERRATIAQIGAEAAKRPDKGLEPVTRSAKDGLVDSALKATGLYNADNLKPEEIWSRLGETGRRLWETTIAARNDAAKMKGEVLRNFLEKFGPLLTGGKFAKALRADLTPEALRDLNIPNGVMLDGSRMNVETLLMAFLNMGTPSSEERLLGGYKWNKAVLLKHIGENVPKPLLDLGQEIMTYSGEKLWPLIAKHAENLNGVAPPKLETQPITIRHLDGTATKYDGGYFAAKYNANASNWARQRVTADSIESLDRGARATVADSFTKARADRYKDVLDLNWSNYPNHVNSVLHYLAYDEPVRSIGSILRDREFRDIATRRLGLAQLEQLDESVRVIARGRASDAAGSVGFASSLIGSVLRSRIISDAMGFSFGMAAQQVPSHTAYAITAGKISAKNGTLALGRALIPENWNQALSKSSELQFRADHYSELFRQALSGQSDITNSWKRKADTAAFSMMDGADRALSHTIWDAAYRDALEGRPLADGTIAGNDAAAVEHADRTVRELMPTHNVFEMANVVRNPGALGALQLFRGLKNVVWNTEASIFDKARVENQGSPMTAAAARYGFASLRILGSAAALHLLGRLWAGHGKNDDDGEGLEGWMTWAERTAAASLVSLNVPFGGEVMESVADHLAHGETLAQAIIHGGKDLRPAPSMQRIQDSIMQLGTMVDDDKETTERVGAATQLLLGNFGGYANQLSKTGGFVRDALTGDAQIRGPGDVAGGLLYGSPGKKNTKNVFTGAQDIVSGNE